MAHKLALLVFTGQDETVGENDMAGNVGDGERRDIENILAQLVDALQELGPLATWLANHASDDDQAEQAGRALRAKTRVIKARDMVARRHPNCR